MKVCFVSPVAELGGSELSLLDVMASLGSLGVTRSLVAFADGELVERARQAGVEAHVLALPESLRQLGESGLRSGGRGWPQFLRASAHGVRFFGFARRFRDLLFRLQPDVLHTNGIKAHVVGATFAPRTLPIAMHVRDYLSERPIARHVLRALLRPSLHVIANSRSVADDVRAVLPSVAVKAIHNAIDTAVFCPGRPERSWLAALAGDDTPSATTLNIGLVATYANWKGQDVFLRAVARLVELQPSVDVVAYIIGGPIYETRGSQFTRLELANMAKDSGVWERMRFIPFQREVERIYRSLDVVVHASTRPEAFGRTIAEAMACARPVVVSQAGGAAELFEEGLTAFGFEPGNSDALAGVLARLCAEPELRARVGQAAREHAAKAFDRARLGEQVLTVYNALLASSKHGAKRVA